MKTVKEILEQAEPKDGQVIRIVYRDLFKKQFKRKNRNQNYWKEISLLTFIYDPVNESKLTEIYKMQADKLYGFENGNVWVIPVNEEKDVGEKCSIKKSNKRG